MSPCAKCAQLGLWDTTDFSAFSSSVLLSTGCFCRKCVWAGGEFVELLLLQAQGNGDGFIRSHLSHVWVRFVFLCCREISLALTAVVAGGLGSGASQVWIRGKQKEVYSVSSGSSFN